MKVRSDCYALKPFTVVLLCKFSGENLAFWCCNIHQNLSLLFTAAVEQLANTCYNVCCE